jgi:hypothetical protein
MQQGQSCDDLQILPYSFAQRGEEGRNRRIDVARACLATLIVANSITFIQNRPPWGRSCDAPVSPALFIAGFTDGICAEAPTAASLRPRNDEGALI